MPADTGAGTVVHAAMGLGVIVQAPAGYFALLLIDLDGDEAVDFFVPAQDDPAPDGHGQKEWMDANDWLFAAGTTTCAVTTQMISLFMTETKDALGYFQVNAKSQESDFFKDAHRQRFTRRTGFFWRF